MHFFLSQEVIDRKYLVIRVAISNYRLQEVANNQVSFRYKDYKTGASVKTMNLQATEFIRRFSLHVLPTKFTRIRHYGIFASKNITTDLNLAKAYFGLDAWEKHKITWSEIAIQKCTITPNQCPKCKGMNF